MPKPFYKHKLLLDEHLPPRQVLVSLNAHFTVKHISHDLHLAGLPDTGIYELAVKQGYIILTINVKDFRALLHDDSPGVIGIPENWTEQRIDSKLTALLIKHGSNYFRGRYRSLSAEDQAKSAS
jgi:predicted nuclease of predicted toxin-antitoxin system